MADLRTVTDLRREGRGSQRRAVYLDGEQWDHAPAGVLRELGVRTGDLIDTAEFCESRAQVEPRLARERALRLLQYRERSHDEVLARLHEDGYLPEVASDVADWLVDTGLVDDARFAENYARLLVSNRGLGRSRALREMSARGVPDAAARDALDAIAPEADEPLRVRASARRLKRTGDTQERLAARLARRGFPPGQALSAAREALTVEADAETLDDLQ